MISLVNGYVIRNGVRRAEPYIAACGVGAECSFPTPIRVPAGEYYLLGDNRGLSDDSRGAWILGTVVHCSLLNTLCRPLR